MLFGLEAAADLKLLIEERTRQYGGFLKDAKRAGEQARRLFQFEVTPLELARMMFCMKLGRLAHGECSGTDTLFDIAGYACILIDLMRATTDE